MTDGEWPGSFRRLEGLVNYLDWVGGECSWLAGLCFCIHIETAVVQIQRFEEFIDQVV